MKKRYLTATGLLALGVCVALAVLALLPPRPGVTKANFDRIEVGMTRVEVEEIFGKPASRRAGFVSASGTTHFEDWPSASGASASLMLRNDAVDAMRWNDSAETITAKLRRWFGF